MQRIKKIWLIGLIVFILAGIGIFFWLTPRYVVPIMMYHNVDYTDVPKANTVSPENFDRHMAYLRDHGFRVISFDELVRLTSQARPIFRKSVVITFDDAYEDNYRHAYRILKKYGYPATIFAPSDLIDMEGYLTWEQMREMQSAGITFGSHSRHHAYLPDLTPAEQKDEIAVSKRILEQQLGVPVHYLAYPIGGFSQPIKQMVREAGYHGAAATNRGYDRFNRDVYELNRIRFSDQDNRNDYLWIKLSGYYNLFRAAKNPY